MRFLHHRQQRYGRRHHLADSQTLPTRTTTATAGRLQGCCSSLHPHLPRHPRLTTRVLLAVVGVGVGARSLCHTPQTAWTCRPSQHQHLPREQRVEAAGVLLLRHHLVHPREGDLEQDHIRLISHALGNSSNSPSESPPLLRSHCKNHTGSSSSSDQIFLLDLLVAAVIFATRLPVVAALWYLI